MTGCEVTPRKGADGMVAAQLPELEPRGCCALTLPRGNEETPAGLDCLGFVGFSVSARVSAEPSKPAAPGYSLPPPLANRSGTAMTTLRLAQGTEKPGCVEGPVGFPFPISRLSTRQISVLTRACVQRGRVVQQ